MGSKDIYKLIYMETNTPVKQSFIESELKKFETEHEITETSLIALAAKYKELKVNGVDDKEGLKAVESARKELKNKRVEIEKVSKGMRESAVKFQKAVISREKELVTLIEPEENRLMKIEDDIWDQKERLREEAEKKEYDRIQNMLDQLREVNQEMDFHELKALTDEQFQEALKLATEIHNNWKILQEQIRVAEEKKQLEEEQARKAEEARLAIEREEQAKRQRKFEEEQAEFRKEQERVRKENEEKAVSLKAEQDRIDAEKKTIQDAKDAEEREKKRQAELKQAREEAAEKARKDAEEKAEREKQEAIEAARALKELEEEKLLAGADKGKFTKLQSQLESGFLSDDVIIWTHFKSKKGKAAAGRVHELLKQANQICKDNV